MSDESRTLIRRACRDVVRASGRRVDMDHIDSYLSERLSRHDDNTVSRFERYLNRLPWEDYEDLIEHIVEDSETGIQRDILRAPRDSVTDESMLLVLFDILSSK